MNNDTSVANSGDETHGVGWKDVATNATLLISAFSLWSQIKKKKNSAKETSSLAAKVESEFADLSDDFDSDFDALTAKIEQLGFNAYGSDIQSVREQLFQFINTYTKNTAASQQNYYDLRDKLVLSSNQFVSVNEKLQDIFVNLDITDASKQEILDAIANSCKIDDTVEPPVLTTTWTHGGPLVVGEEVNDIGHLAIGLAAILSNTDITNKIEAHFTSGDDPYNPGTADFCRVTLDFYDATYLSNTILPELGDNSRLIGLAGRRAYTFVNVKVPFKTTQSLYESGLKFMYQDPAHMAALSEIGNDIPEDHYTRNVIEYIFGPDGNIDMMDEAFHTGQARNFMYRLYFWFSHGVRMRFNPEAGVYSIAGSFDFWNEFTTYAHGWNRSEQIG